MRRGAIATEVEPIGRAPKHVLLQQMRRLGSDLLMTSVADGSGSFISILNPQRQIVYANKALQDAFGVTGENAIGLRPGELMGCRNVNIGPDGCGTSANCSTCGTATAVRKARRGSPHQEECRIIREDGDPIDLKVNAAPVSFDGDEYILYSAIDISDTKRRRSLERIFFHDIMNTATGVRGLSSLARIVPTDERDEMLELIEETSEHLIDEIEGQRDLLAAESRELVVKLQPIDSSLLLKGLTALYEAHEVGEGKSIVIDQRSYGATFVSDPTLLGRVVGNLIKNALEATRPGGMVRVRCNRDGEWIFFTVHNASVIPDASQAQIFQRSFSTKGEGRGLGTYGSRLLTERYLNGEIRFISAPGIGTTFTVALPLDTTAV